MGLLDDYQKMVEEDEKNLNNNAPMDGFEMSEEEYQEYVKRLNQMRDEMKNKDNYSVDTEKCCNEAAAKYPKFGDEGLNCVDVKVTPVVRRAFCPECGQEIVNTVPPMFNPFTFEKINIVRCSKCGWEANLEHSYPRIVLVDENGNEYEAFAK